MKNYEEIISDEQHQEANNQSSALLLNMQQISQSYEHIDEQLNETENRQTHKKKKKIQILHNVIQASVEDRYSNNKLDFFHIVHQLIHKDILNSQTHQFLKILKQSQRVQNRNKEKTQGNLADMLPNTGKIEQFHKTVLNDESLQGQEQNCPFAQPIQQTIQRYYEESSTWTQKTVSIKECTNSQFSSILISHITPKITNKTEQITQYSI